MWSDSTAILKLERAWSCVNSQERISVERFHYCPDFNELGVALTPRDGPVWSVSTKRVCDHAEPVTPRHCLESRVAVKVQVVRNHFFPNWVSSRDSDPSARGARATPHVCHGDHEAVAVQEAIGRSETNSLACRVRQVGPLARWCGRGVRSYSWWKG